MSNASVPTKAAFDGLSLRVTLLEEGLSKINERLLKLEQSKQE